MFSLISQHSILIALLTQTSIILIGLFLHYQKSYGSEKAKNLATKEDIAEITKIVENIKNNFITETEKLKGNLQFENQVKVSLYTDMKNSITNLYESYNVWYHFISNSSTNSIEFNSERLKEVEKELTIVYEKFLIAQAKADLYVNNDNLNKIVAQLGSQTLLMEEIVEKYFLDLEVLIDEEEELDEMNELNSNDEKRLDEISLEIRKLYKACHEKVVKMEKDITTVNLEFADICREILTTIK